MLHVIACQETVMPRDRAILHVIACQQTVMPRDRAILHVTACQQTEAASFNVIQVTSTASAMPERADTVITASIGARRDQDRDREA